MLHYRMKIKFLGTGGALGVPIWNCECKTCTSDNPKNKRFRSVLLVEINGKNIVIDFGQDFAMQLRQNGIKKIDYAFLTHAHMDHFAGKEQFSVADNCIIEMPQDVLDRFLDKANPEWILKRNPSISIRPFVPREIEGVFVDTVKLMHQMDYGKCEHVPCYGYVFRSSDFSFAYCTDFNEILESHKLKDLDLLILEGCGWEVKGGHAGVKGSLEIYKHLKPRKCILTHINHSTEHDEIVEFLSPYPDVVPAYDGMEFMHS